MPARPLPLAVGYGPPVAAAEPLVSVVLAVHDGEPFVRTAVESVLRQTVADLELIVVDDASTDGTASFLSTVPDRRLVVHRNERRQGLATSLNVALDQARGRFVARLDADDVAMPERLERQVAHIESGSSLAVVGTAALEVDDEDCLGRLLVMPRGAAAVRWAALFSSPFLHPTVLIRRHVLEEHGLRYDPEFLESEDYDLWSRVLSVGDGDNLQHPLVLYRVHSQQASRRRWAVQRDFQLRVALREIARVAPELAPGEAKLAWRVGAGEKLEDAEVEEAVAAYVELVEAFERRYPSRSGRRAAAWALARAARRAGPAAGVHALGQALRLDRALPVHGLSRSAGRGRRARAARSVAKSWLEELDRSMTNGRTPIRVTAVFPEPTPYRAPLLDRVAALEEVDLTVIYAAPTVARRTWQVEGVHETRVLRGVRFPGARRLLLHDYPVTPGVWRALGRTQPDVVVVSGWSTFAAQGSILWCRLRGIPYLLVVESHDAGPRPGWRRKVKGTVVPPIVRGAAGVLVTGSLARRSMIERGAAPERIHVFANTIDVESFGERADRLSARRVELRRELRAGPDDVVVLSVARLVREKAHDVLIRAVAATGDPRLVLVLAGSGPAQDGLETLAREHDVRLVLAGDRPWERIVEVYAAADVFALVSEREPWAVVVNEASACGLPLVLSDRVGAAHDLLRDGENGVLVRAGDIAGAAAALRRLAADPDERHRMGARSRELVRNWGYGPSVAGFLVAVRTAVSDTGPGPASH
jgi:glycosyltransferase involved in cell wall biosynthesis